MSDQPSGESPQAAGNGASSPPGLPPGLVRYLFHRWFFSTERRYMMFQTIVGGTIANLLAAGIIAGIAITVGAIHVSFSWSWTDALTIIGVVAAATIFVPVLYAREAFRDRRKGKATYSTGEVIAGALAAWGTSIVLLAILVIFLTFVHVSIGHKGPAYPSIIPTFSVPTFSPAPSP